MANTAAPLTPAVVAEHGLSPDEFLKIREILGHEPNLVELGIYSALWSEHCSYKSSKPFLKEFPTACPRVLQGPVENAGAVDIGDGLAVVFKMESHNHPSFIEPYQGAASGVGGILRDVFTMGARPLAILDGLFFGDPAAPRMRGIGGYGNCIGVPTVGGMTFFHPAYDKNILVNAMAVGLVRQDRIFRAKAAGPGNQVLQGDAVVAIQDMGAAGLTSSTFEMCARGGVGMELDLSKVPMRETGMTPYELMLSESQERMVLV